MGGVMATKLHLVVCGAQKTMENTSGSEGFSEWKSRSQTCCTSLSQAQLTQSKVTWTGIMLNVQINKLDIISCDLLLICTNL